MKFYRLKPGRRIVATFCLLVLPLIAAGFGGVAQAAAEFPFDREMLLDVAPMRPVKRVPIITVSADGRATIDLWCRTVAARMQIDGNAIRIETAPLPEALPQYMSAGQCSEARMAADNDLLAALAQVTEWQSKGDGLVLSGPDLPKPMRFRASSH
jgi:heat shock protein HslJ